MKETRVGGDQAFIAHDQAAEMPQPGKGAFDNPAMPETAQLAAILMRRLTIVAPRWDDRLDPAPHQGRTQRIAVVTPIGHQPIRSLARPARLARPSDRHGVQGFLQQGHFRRGRRVQVCSQRSTRAIDQNQPLGALAAFGLADFVAPFFAGAKLPSAKHSSQRIFWRSLSWARNARHRLRNTPASSQARSRRHTVLGLPYWRGSSLHGAPVHKIHKMPSKHCRSETRGRPPLGFGFAAGSCFSTSSHCLSVSFRQAMPQSLARPF